jgi:hypothetical protein
MKWIVVAILVMIVPYTYVTLRYRRPEPAFQPYQDMQNRANVARLLSAGYQRIPLPAQRPVDPLPVGLTAAIFPAAGGLPAELRSTLVSTPLLPADITQVSAPLGVGSGEAYPFRFACTLPDQKRQLAGADLYLKGTEIIVAPDYEKLSGELAARSNDNVVQLSVPAGTLKPGRYHVTVIGERSSRAWSFEVR